MLIKIVALILSLIFLFLSLLLYFLNKYKKMHYKAMELLEEYFNITEKIKNKIKIQGYKVALCNYKIELLIAKKIVDTDTIKPFKDIVKTIETMHLESNNIIIEWNKKAKEIMDITRELFNPNFLNIFKYPQLLKEVELLVATIEDLISSYKEYELEVDRIDDLITMLELKINIE